MKTSMRIALAAAVALCAVVGPAVAAPAALAQTRTHSAAPHSGTLNIAALERSIAGLPAADATAAVVRVGGRAGSWQGVTGVHDLASGRAALAGGRFRAGSVTKVFTAAVVLQLVAEGRVALDRPVREYLPELFPAGLPPITVAQLLDHTSGLQPADGPVGGFEEAYAHRFDRVTPEEMVTSSTAKGLEFTPGEKQHYLNINYTVLGLLIERMTGDSYERQVQRRILNPLGLHGTSYPGNGHRILGPHNRGYQRTDSGLVDVTEWNMSASWAAGDIISTAADLERFTVALFGGRVVPRAQLRLMLQVPEGITMYGSTDPASYTMGMSRSTLPDGTVGYGKSGERYGYTTGIAATLDAAGRIDRTLVYSVNSTDAKSATGNPRTLPVILAAFE